MDDSTPVRKTPEARISARWNGFHLYNASIALVSTASLIVLVAEGPYRNVPKTEPPDPWLTAMALLTMFVAGATGGVMCNLRGIFKHHQNSGAFPDAMRVPFYIRPLLGALSGVLVFFVSHFLAASLNLDLASEASSRSWESLSGRVPYIALALLAGFASQEFMNRLKETARALFQYQPNSRTQDSPPEENDSD